VADLIVKRGGKPTMEHEGLDFGGEDLKGMLEKQVVLETEAIEMYKRSIAVIDDPEVVGVMKHALDEEKRIEKSSKNAWRHFRVLSTQLCQCYVSTYIHATKPHSLSAKFLFYQQVKF
jgi:bacterioferritin (cytochrome b1)